MKFSKGFLLVTLILPWFTLPILGKRSAKRFMPAALLMVVVVVLVNWIAKKRNWWIWFERLNPNLSGVFPFNWGPFLIGSLWILKWTYGKLFSYLLVNLLFDSFFVYVMVEWLQKLRIATLVRMKKYQLSFILFIQSMLLYFFQMLCEKRLGGFSKYLKKTW